MNSKTTELNRASNYQNALDQMRNFGLLIDALQVTGSLVKCDVEGGYAKGWYILHEIRLKKDQLAIMGSYGKWQHGVDLTVQKIDPYESSLLFPSYDDIVNAVIEFESNHPVGRNEFDLFDIVDCLIDFRTIGSERLNAFEAVVFFFLEACCSLGFLESRVSKGHIGMRPSNESVECRLYKIRDIKSVEKIQSYIGSNVRLKFI